MEQIIMKQDKTQVFNMDCMEYMQSIPDGYFDLSIVDPPYGIGQPKQSNLKGYNGRKSLEERLKKNRLNTGSGKLKNRVLNNSNCDWDEKIPKKEYFKELIRISKNQVIWGGNYFGLSPTRCVICWDKMQPWENFSQWEMAWTSFDRPARIFKFDNRTGDKIHPTQKPIKLYEWLLMNYAKEGDKILDTHLGSQSSRIASYNLGFEFVGTELDQEYFEQGCKRFDNHKKQLTLF
jgi:site-specific DNA-methyltransferase (adenine-specific)